MWSAIFELTVLLLLAWFVWRFVARRLPNPLQPAEPDDRANVPARLRPRPQLNAGAVALAEPDEDEEEPEFVTPPRRIWIKRNRGSSDSGRRGGRRSR
jgi:hypothetical protein